MSITTQLHEAQVLVVGAGPVGLTLAIDLAQRGVDVLLLEQRRDAEPPSAKCNHVSARSMEIFRRLGFARAVRDAGLPADHPHDVAYRTTFTGIELSRIRIASRGERGTPRDDGADSHWPTPEPPHRVNQIYLEPVLRAQARATRGLRLLDGVRIDRVTQDAHGTSAHGVQLADQQPLHLRGAFLVGCDGARSQVRRAIGANFTGTGELGRVQSTFFQAPTLRGLAQHPPAWATFSLNPRRSGNVYAIDGRETWLLHNYLRVDEHDFDAVDRDASIRTILGVGPDFRYRVIAKEDWIARRLVADRFRDRRIFICGDAAHVWVPMAGYGMNAGIADAANLAWLLAAHVAGWAPESVLAAYETERRPITEQVSRFAMDHALALQRQREQVPTDLEAPGPRGDAARAAAGRALFELNVRQYCAGGLNFGSFYDASPLVAYDGESAPAYTMDAFTPSSVPGCRTPHLWLDDGRSLYDALGPDYTLLRFDPRVPIAPMEAAAQRRGVPLRVLDVASREAAALYRHALVLSRPDQHVAWRGDRVPDDPLALVDRVRGALAPDNS